MKAHLWTALSGTAILMEESSDGLFSSPKMDFFVPFCVIVRTWVLIEDVEDGALLPPAPLMSPEEHTALE